MEKSAALMVADMRMMRSDGRRSSTSRRMMRRKSDWRERSCTCEKR